MDYISIPAFALFRYGTVITRIKMEKVFGHLPGSCHHVEVQRHVYGAVHRPSNSEHCTRTRLVSQCSDCDSDLIGKCRPYRTKSPKSRYVNVSAAVCLLFLVSGLTLQASAAPYRTPDMEDWLNPCTYKDSNAYKTRLALDQYKKYAREVAADSRDQFDDLQEFKKDIAKLHSFESYEGLVDMWQGTEWLRSADWFIDEVLPVDKGDNKAALEKIMHSDKLKETLPLLLEATKMLGINMQAVANGLKENDYKEKKVKEHLIKISSRLRGMLCYITKVVRAFDLPVPLSLPNVNDYSGLKKEDIARDAFLIFRDTFDFLQYIGKFFEALIETDIKSDADA